MTIYVGIDIGTSGTKVILTDQEGLIHASATCAVEVDRPYPGWSEQHPDIWWNATIATLDELTYGYPQLMARIKAIGLSGQMLGSVLLGKDDVPIYPCLLWNDQRSLAECQELLERVPDIGMRTNGYPDPGLTAPKLLWLRKNEPQLIDQADILMLPKDYIRLKLTGERATEPSDASGTMLMDCKTKTWDPELLTAAGWTSEKLPKIIQSYSQAGFLRSELQKRFGIQQLVIVAAGTGDNFAASLGVGAALKGDAVITIGTSGVLCAVDSEFHPAPQSAILTAPHAAPHSYLSMAVVMSATQSLDWIATLTGKNPVDLIHEAAMRFSSATKISAPVMRPSITGVRTPHNRPDAGAALSQISASCDAVDLAYSAIEGVSFQFLESYHAQSEADVPINEITVVGGGSQSDFWVELLATLLEKHLMIPDESASSACLGAARLADASLFPSNIGAILSRKPVHKRFVAPNFNLSSILKERYEIFKALPF